MAVRKLIEVDTTDRSDGKVPAWDAATGTHIYVDPATAAPFTTPSVRAIGTPASGTGAVVPGLPSGHVTGDILVLLVQSDNEAASAPATYQQMGPVAGIGTAAAAGGTRLTAFWKRDGGSESDPTVADTGDHTLAVILAIQDCPTVGDPFLNVGATRKTTASTTGTGSAGATPVDACLVMQAFSHALDSASAVFSSWTNADLTSVTESVDTATADGNGGGIGVATGIKAKAGTFAATTVTETSTTDVGLAWVFLPSGINARAGFVDTQIFLTPGADTWYKPTAAKRADMTAIGGGASGSSGRNAATAAGGGGGGGGGWDYIATQAGTLASSLVIAVGAGGAASTNADGQASNAGALSSVTSGSVGIARGSGGNAATASASGAGGAGGAGGGKQSTTPAAAAFADYFGNQKAAGGTGATTAAAGGRANDFGGGGGAGGGTTQAASGGGPCFRGGGGGGGGRSDTTVGTGGTGGGVAHAVAGASGAGEDSPNPMLGGAGGNAGTSTSGPGGQGGWPGGGGGGGGSQSGAQRSGAGGDGCVTIITHC